MRSGPRLRRCADLLADGGVFCAYRYDFPVIEGPARVNFDIQGVMAKRA